MSIVQVLRPLKVFQNNGDLGIVALRTLIRRQFRIKDFMESWVHQLQGVQADLLHGNWEVHMVEAALLKLMRKNRDAGLVYISQESKDANYFQFFV